MMKNSLKRFTAILACTALTTALALPAQAADQPIRVGSYKGTTLEVGERSGLMIGPSGPAYTVTSSDPNTVAVEQALDVRLELVRLVNEVRRENGVPELTVNEALMDAAQTISDKKYTWHHTREECEAALACGYPYGFGVNLTVFTGVATEDTAQHALDNWLNSPGHFETMIKPDCDSIGVGVTESGSVTYCYLFVGRPNTHNPYE